MRFLSLLAVVVVAGCGSTDEPATTVAADATGIECRLGREPAFGRVCTFESEETERGIELVVRRPDGGFRRLIRTGSTVEAADGAETARVARLADGRLEVEIGGDAFRLPPSVPE